jgi:hypothetical protein
MQRKKNWKRKPDHKKSSSTRKRNGVKNRDRHDVPHKHKLNSQTQIPGKRVRWGDDEAEGSTV